MRLYVAKFNDCIAVSALTHEFVHFFHRLVLKITDAPHSREPYWPSACKEEDYSSKEEFKMCQSTSVCRIANWELYENSCGGF